MTRDTTVSPEEIRERATEMAAAGNYEIARLLRGVADDVERAARDRARRVPRSLRGHPARGPIGGAASG